MIRADGTVKTRPLESLRSLLAAVPTPSAARLLFVAIVSCILVVATGDSLGRVWPYVALIIAAILAITVLYFASRFPTRTGPVATSIATLQSSTELFQAAFDFAAIGMALVFPNGRCQRVNRSLCEILGYTDQELLATDFQDFVHPDERLGARTKWEQLLSGKIPGYQIETRCIHKDGQEVWVLWSVSKATVEHSESAHLIFQIQDIADRKAAEERRCFP